MHPRFRDFNARLWIMGDYAESAFKDYAAHHDLIVIRFGMDRPPFKYFPQVPALLRAAPDFLVETGRNKHAGLLTKQPGDGTRSATPRHCLVEVKGCGSDQTFKLKDETLTALRTWQQITARPVVFFLYNQPEETICFSLSLDRLESVLPSLERGFFLDNGKERPFVKLPASHPILRWEVPCSPAGPSTSTAVSSTAMAAS